MADDRKLVTFTRLDQIQRTPLRSVIDGILFENTLASVVGKSGSCKSFLAQGMCASVATGTTWMGRRVQQGACFYLGGEGMAGIRKRFDAWSEYTRLSLVEAPIYIASGLPSLCDQLNVAAVIDEISTVAEEIFFSAGGIEPKLIVVDTFARAMAGADENSASEVGKIIAGLDWIRERWGACVLVIHHTGYGEANKERGRGSSAYYAALDSELLVTTDGAAVRVRSTKEKHWAKPPELYLDRHTVQIDIDGVAETSLVLDQAQGPSEFERALELRENIRRLKAGGSSIRKIADELGVSKGKVEHELDVLSRADEYKAAKDGL